MTNSPNQRAKIAIVSDIHCHQSSENNGRKESFLLSDALRSPSGRHPVQSLIDLINKESLSADVLLCAGDITNKISLQGFSSAIQNLEELRQNFGSTNIIYTLGNHDVASRIDQGDPFNIAKTIHPTFPFTDNNLKDHFWRWGYYLDSSLNCADILSINTAFNHFSEPEAKRGTFPDVNLDHLKNYLEDNFSSKPKIAVLHHHPLLHSTSNFDSSDVLANGDQLLKLLISNNFKFVIHGHRHEPRISRYYGNGYCIHVFGSGSFSAYLNELSSTTRNLFHILDIEINKHNELIGNLISWEFNYGSGWNPATLQSAGIPHYIFIGPNDGDELSNLIPEHFRKISDQYIGTEKLKKYFPQLFYLLPEELKILSDSLISNNGIKLEINEYGEILGAGIIISS